VIQASAQLYARPANNKVAYEILRKRAGQVSRRSDLLYDSRDGRRKLDRMDVVEAKLTRLVELTPVERARVERARLHARRPDAAA
jgi:hypothetical protein